MTTEQVISIADIESVTVRMPADLLRAIQAQAHAEDRTRSKMIIRLLRAALAAARTDPT